MNIKIHSRCSILGASPSTEGIQFRIWAPESRAIDVVLESEPKSSHSLQRTGHGYFEGIVPSAQPGTLYRYRVNGQGPYPDPASRFQPHGVHGPSQVIDPRTFAWSDAGWQGIELKHLIVYELHIGTFTPSGTFSGLMDRLSYLKELGVTALELMPVAEFPGRHNWGYDGVSLFAPSHTYGQPDDLRRLVNRAHHMGLAVILDVVYNHLGPDGNYLGLYSPYYFTSRHTTPWGPAVNLDGEHAEEVREFFIENTLHWIHEYHLDGLRLDATHAMIDESQRRFLAQLSARVHDSVKDRHIHLIAEDCRNLSQIVKPESQGGWGLDAVWSDDFHHQVRRSLTGDHEGYFRDFSGTLDDLCTTVQRGWFFSGQFSEHFGGPRGTDPAGIAPERFIFFIQNHDQIGNRAFGERLNLQVDPATYRAASVLLLSVPETPLLFMGQEWGAGSPFLYFTDHEGELGQKVTEGRRSEFKDFSNFSDSSVRQRIPDPQNPETFNRSRLNWGELEFNDHAPLHQLYRTLLHWRIQELSQRSNQSEDFRATVLNQDVLSLMYSTNDLARFLVIIRWRGAGRQELPVHMVGHWQVVLTTEDPLFCLDSQPIRLNDASVHFQRPGALILRPQIS